MNASEDSLLTQLEGQVLRVIFTSQETDYTVLAVEIALGDIIHAVGVLPPVGAGEHLRLRGRWIIDPKHGRQFEVRDWESVPPVTSDAIRRFLSSGIVKGIGVAMAHRLVDHFGADTLNVLSESPERLREIRGLGEKRRQIIDAAWRDHQQFKRVALFLTGHGVSANLSRKIYAKFGEDSVRIVTEQTYRLAREIDGVGFRTADHLAQRFGIPTDDPERVVAALRFALEQGGSEGHTYLPEGLLLTRTSNLIELPVERIRSCLESLLAQGELIPTSTALADPGVYLPSYDRLERALARRVGELRDATEDRLAGLAEIWQRSFRSQADSLGGASLSDEQLRAVHNALAHRVSILTGGPGTGKTLTIRAILAIAQAQQRSGIVCAPTGKAAKRLTETTGVEAKTIHRMLGLRPGSAALHNDANPLAADLIIIDEASMLDLFLAQATLKAVAPGTHVLFVGDADQLPAVGAGNVLRDLIASECVETTRLSTVFRQASTSGIVLNAHRINAGQPPVTGKTIRDFYILNEADPHRALELVVDLVTRRLPNHYKLDPAEDIRVLSPMHGGVLGVAQLNRHLQEALNPRVPARRELPQGNRVFRIGDRVLCLRNDYQRDVFNGDEGVVSAIDEDTAALTVQFDAYRPVRYENSDLDDLTHAFALSVHKSQGSEFPCVVVVLHRQHLPMAQRNLLYTAITRARKLVVVVTANGVIPVAIANERPTRRYTGLADKLRNPERATTTSPREFSWSWSADTENALYAFMDGLGTE